MQSLGLTQGRTTLRRCKKNLGSRKVNDKVDVKLSLTFSKNISNIRLSKFDRPGEKNYDNVKRRIENGWSLSIGGESIGRVCYQGNICLRDNSVLNLTPNTSVISEMILECLVCLKSKYVSERIFF